MNSANSPTNDAALSEKPGLITLKRVSDSIAESQSGLDQLAFRNLPVPLAVIDKRGIISRANRALGSLWGSSPDRLAGLPFQQVSARVISKVLDSNEEISVESRLKTAAGVESIIRWTLCPMTVDDEGDPLILISGLDITQRRREQERARLTEARLQATLILSRMSMDDQSRIYEYTLGQAVELTGSRVGFIALVDRDRNDLEIPAWSRPLEAEPAIGHRRLICSLESADSWADPARTGTPLIANQRVPRDILKREYPGGHGPLKRQMSVPVYSDGELVMIAGVADREDDYTDSEVRLLTLLMEDLWMVIQRQRAQQRLETSEERYRLLVESMSEGLAIFDVDFSVTHVNDSLCRMLGYEAGEIMELTLASFLDESGLEIFYDQMARRRTQISAPYEMQWRTRSGRRLPALVAPQPLFDHSGNFIGSFAILTDISKQKQVEEKLHRVNESLAAEQRALTEKNIALKELMSQIEDEKRAIQRQLQSNIDRVVLPLMRTLKAKSGDDSRVYVDLIENCLQDITSPFVNRLERRFQSLSPRETEVCNMIKAGLNSKDIAAALDTSVHTVHNQRKQIRRKLGLAGGSANLTSYLNSLSD